MITFKYYVHKSRKKTDGTWRVSIRMTYQRKSRYIPTSVFVTKKDITTSFKIKNYALLDKLEGLTMDYRKKSAELNLEEGNMPIDVIYDCLVNKSNAVSMSFNAFFDKWCATTKKKGIKNYVTAVNAYKSFLGRDTILFTDITNANMKSFEMWLEGKQRAQSMYTSAIKHIFEEARFTMNDEDNNIIVIKHSLSKYVPPKQNVAKKRALSVENILSIFALPYDNIKVRGFSSRHDIALDCFRLSFCLMGMNSADLYNATDYDGEYIIYNRTKTKDRRNDNAEMKIRVSDYIRPLVEKYRGAAHVFNFSERFGSYTDLNRTINIGLKEVGKEIGVDNLQFYSARHSMATIAVNRVGISKYVVNDMLCHVDSSMKITDLYIEKDFSAINEANDKLLAYVFGEMEKIGV